MNMTVAVDPTARATSTLTSRFSALKMLTASMRSLSCRLPTCRPRGLELGSDRRCTRRMLRSLVVALTLGLLFAAVAEAKLNPSFSQRTAQPGDEIELDVGEGSALFVGPLRIFLVSLEGSDRDQIKIGELGTPGKFDAPQILRFEVPDVP